MGGEDLSALARRAQAGEARARHELLVELYGVVRRFVALLARSATFADDAVQETMIAVHRGLDRFRGDASPRTWALTIAARTVRRMRRREARYALSDDGVIDAAVFDVDQVQAAELALLRRTLASLAPKKRDAFVLMEIFELSATEAGKALGTFANTAASRARHARAELGERLRARSVDENGPLAATTGRGHG